MTVIAKNWSSTGNAKVRNVKISSSRTGDVVRITLTDTETNDFMQMAFDKDYAAMFANSILSMCKENKMEQTS